MNQYVHLSEAEREARWRAEEDARTLRRAQEITRDETRSNNAREFIKEEISNLSSIADVKPPRINDMPPQNRHRKQSNNQPHYMTPSKGLKHVTHGTDVPTIPFRR